MGYELPADYVDVAERIREFREKHPDGTLQQVEWGVRDVDGKTFVFYTAAAYRTPDDERPGIGTAWEPLPGRTPYTRDSELMNAETSAWGRAIIAAGAADAKRVASANEVANRRTDTPPSTPKSAAVAPAPASDADDTILPTMQDVADVFADVFVFQFGKHKGVPITEVPTNYLEWLLKQKGKPEYEERDAKQHAIYRAELERRAGA